MTGVFGMDVNFFSPKTLCSANACLCLKDSGWFGLYALHQQARTSRELLSKPGARKNTKEKQCILRDSSWSILTRAAHPSPHPPLQ